MLDFRDMHGVISIDPRRDVPMYCSCDKTLSLILLPLSFFKRVNLLSYYDNYNLIGQVVMSLSHNIIY